MSGANNRFKVDNGLVASGNAIFYDRVDVQANAFFNNDLFVVSGNLTVNGTLVFANVVIGNGGVIPISDQQPLGNTSNRFNAFLYDTTSYGTLRPNANGGALGTTTERFQVFANNITVTNTVNFPSGAGVNSSLYTGTASNANTVYNISANGIVVRTGTGTGTTVSIASANGISVTNGNGVSGNPTVGFVANAGLIANAGGVWVDASAITAENSGNALLPLLLPFTILAIPLLDFAMAIIRRLRAGRSPFSADREHIHHRIMRMGLTQQRTTVVLYLWTAMFAIPTAIAAFIPIWFALLSGVLIFAVSVLVIKQSKNSKVIEKNHVRAK